MQTLAFVILNFMWKKIDAQFALSEIRKGNFITTSPDDCTDQYQILDAGFDYVKTLHTSSMTNTETFTPHTLLAGEWWIRNQEVVL